MAELADEVFPSANGVLFKYGDARINVAFKYGKEVQPPPATFLSL
jgi:hypothetical protein